MSNPLNRPLTIIFCLPGNSFSNNFLMSWSGLLQYCFSHQIQPIISCKQSSCVYFVRNMCLGADVTRGKNQKPFNGEINYDFIMWIDSDQVFAVEHFIQLLKHDKDVVSGLYLMSNKTHYTAVKDWDEEHFKKNGSFEFMCRYDLMQWINKNADKSKLHQQKTQNGEIIYDIKDCELPLMEVTYTGLGWTLIKKGVFEQMEYPWFYGKRMVINDGEKEMVDYTSEDVTFFLNLKEKGIKAYVDVKAIVGHEKSFVI